jgi:hypothetical protein
VFQKKLLRRIFGLKGEEVTEKQQTAYRGAS